MKIACKLLILSLGFVALPACDQFPNANKKDGIKDALDTRPNEKLRDMGEDMERATKDVGRDLKNAVDPK
jgi:hypothetical protein